MVNANKKGQRKKKKGWKEKKAEIKNKTGFKKWKTQIKKENALSSSFWRNENKK